MTKAEDDVEAAQDFFKGDKPAEKPKAKAEDSGKISALERKIKDLEQKLEIIKKQQKIDLVHAKKKAVEMSEEMLQQKMEACRLAYENEFETLAS